MSIESTSTSHFVGKAAHSGAGGKGSSASAGAGDAMGFLAMLSAADDALALPADASGLSDGPQGAADTLLEEGKDPSALDADANLLAGWVLGGAVPVVQESAPRPSAGHVGWSTAGADAGAASPVSTPARKMGKTLGTSELQQTHSSVQQGLSVLQGQEQATKQLPDAKVVAPMPELVPTPLTENHEVAPVAVLVALGERHQLEPAISKAAPAEGLYSQSQAASAPMGMDGVVATQSAAPLEAYIAEQVTYWISQDVQSAELTLDGMGASPVEVSISMQGNEAQVAFRTDELHARAAIENASEQLKDSLQRQGVVLTGMSVGTSHGGDASGQGRRPRQEGRQAVVTAPAPAQVDTAVRQLVPQGRAVDLFV